ncbi:MAG: hypothetical protein JNL79_15965 [Myxococcales bacterium]|nr:hypothetical protein [Myxococcales bacterium]
MNVVHHELRVRGPHGFQRGLPPGISGLLLEGFQASVAGAVRMAFEGSSRVVGHRRSWLNAAADVRFDDLEVGDEAVLHFTARPFGDVAEGIYDQGELWASRPDPAWSAIDAVAAVVDDVGGTRSDSDRFDSGLLRNLLRFRRVLGDEISELRIEAKHRPGQDVGGFATVDSPMIEQARSLNAETPEPREARVVGSLDMLRRSTQAFALRLDDGQEVRGVLIGEDVSTISASLGHRVVVQGQAIFRPSGKLLRLDARAVLPGEGEGAFWSKVPAPAGSIHPRTARRALQTPTTGVNAFFGRWPGNESDDALLAMLDEVR